MPIDEDTERRGFVGGWNTIGYYLKTDCADIPDKPGVYIVNRGEIAPPQFIYESPIKVYKGKPLAPYEIADLESRWDPRNYCVYIGQAGGNGSQATLKNRIKQYLAWGAGRVTTPHSGGRAIWQIKGSEQFRVAWSIQPDRDRLDVERELLDYHIEKYGRLPFANRRR